MTDIVTTAAAASGAALGGSAAAVSGLPPQEVIFWALIGGLVSVWLSQRSESVALTLGMVLSGLMQLCIAALSGIALSALALAIAPNYAWLAPLAAVPRWALAGLIAAAIFKVGPLCWSWLQRRAGVGNEGGTPNA